MSKYCRLFRKGKLPPSEQACKCDCEDFSISWNVRENIPYCKICGHNQDNTELNINDMHIDAGIGLVYKKVIKRS